MLQIVFLGTGGTLPTPNRNPVSIAIKREGELILFDCGEGTQQQMVRAKTGMKIKSIFVTHFHGDHFLGIPGLIQTLSFLDRKEPMEIYGPKGMKNVMHHLLSICPRDLGYEIRVGELEPGDEVKGKGYSIKAIRVEHGCPAVGYVLQEDMRRGKFNRERAIELGVPPGPLFSKLHSGHSVKVGGRVVRPEEVVGPPRPGRKIVYTGDTRPCEDVVEAAMDADVLIHDGSLSHELKDWALETMHSTAYEAAYMAKRAGVRMLFLIHISPRYSKDASVLVQEAKQIFENVEVAQEFMVVDVPFRDKGDIKYRILE